MKEWVLGSPNCLPGGARSTAPARLSDPERSAQCAHIPGYTSLDNDAQPSVTFSFTHFVTNYSPVRIQDILSGKREKNRGAGRNTG